MSCQACVFLAMCITMRNSLWNINEDFFARAYLMGGVNALWINGSSEKMCPAIKSSSEGSNGTSMLSLGTCKTNIKVGPALSQWADLITSMPDETESVSSTLLRRFSCTRATTWSADQLEAYTFSPPCVQRVGSTHALNASIDKL